MLRLSNSSRRRTLFMQSSRRELQQYPSRLIGTCTMSYQASTDNAPIPPHYECR